jgi:serine acetyltransferase
MKNLMKALMQLKRRVVGDYEATQAQRTKYQKEHRREWLPVQLVTDIGLQSMAAVRLMQFARDARVPFGGEVMSRLIRYVYNMEIHWNAEIDPGLTLIHGGGLVISKHAHISPNCIVAHNVTFGAAWDPETRTVGGPTLEENVHVGPGATIIGPITIGANSKIMAGAVLSESVPPFTLVTPAKPTCVSRSVPRTASSAGSGTDTASLH